MELNILLFPNATSQFNSGSYLNDLLLIHSSSFSFVHILGKGMHPMETID